MHIGIRAAIGIGSVGGVIGSGYYLNKLLSNENIQSKLEANKYTILTSDEKNKRDWDAILVAYKATITDPANNKFKLENFEPKNPPSNEEDRSKFQEACKKTLEKRTFEDTKEEEIYKKAKKWCTVPKKLIEILKEKGYRLLDSDDKDSSQWDAKLDDYEKSDKKFDNLATLKEATKTLEKNEATRKKLKVECKKLEGKKHYEKDFEKELDKSILWCAVKETNKQ